MTELLRSHVDSYEQLEILVLFGRQPGAQLTTPAVASSLTMLEDTAAEGLRQLAVKGLLEPRPGPSGEVFECRPEWTDQLGRLAIAHRDAHVDLITLMTNNALERLRTSALRAFSAAFFLGRKRDG